MILAAHMDEIGLIVTHIEKGFIRFTSIGGVRAAIALARGPGLLRSHGSHLCRATGRC